MCSFAVFSAMLFNDVAALPCEMWNIIVTLLCSKTARVEFHNISVKSNRFLNFFCHLLLMTGNTFSLLLTVFPVFLRCIMYHAFSTVVYGFECFEFRMIRVATSMMIIIVYNLIDT